MSQLSDIHHGHTITPVIQLKKLSRLDYETGGVLPRIIAGFVIEAEIFEGTQPQYPATEAYWLKAVIDETQGVDKQNLEFVAFSGDLDQIEELAISLANTTTSQTFRHQLTNLISGYYTQAKVDRSEEPDVSLDGQELLEGVIASHHKGFCLTLSRGKAHRQQFGMSEKDPNRVVTSIYGELDADGVGSLLMAVGNLRAWRDLQLDVISKNSTTTPAI